MSSLKVENIQIRRGHRAIVDLVGKSIHILSVPMPNWVKEAVESLHDRSQGRRRSNLSDRQPSWNSVAKRESPRMSYGPRARDVLNGCRWIISLRMIFAEHARNFAM